MRFDLYDRILSLCYRYKMTNFDQAISFLELAQAVVGKEGPVALDTGILKHNSKYDDNPRYGDNTYRNRQNSKDIITIGKDGEIINHQDLIDAITEICDKKIYQKQFESGRSYYFEGISSTKNDTHFMFLWGS